MLLVRGAKVGAAASDGATSLLIASQAGHLEVVRELLARGAAVDAAMNNGATPLQFASNYGHSEVVRRELLARTFVRVVWRKLSVHATRALNRCSLM
jgi:ankyrin repeat protein